MAECVVERIRNSLVHSASILTCICIFQAKAFFIVYLILHWQASNDLSHYDLLSCLTYLLLPLSWLWLLSCSTSRALHKNPKSIDWLKDLPKIISCFQQDQKVPLSLPVTSTFITLVFMAGVLPQAFPNDQGFGCISGCSEESLVYCKWIKSIKHCLFGLLGTGSDPKLYACTILFQGFAIGRDGNWGTCSPVNSCLCSTGFLSLAVVVLQMGHLTWRFLRIRYTLCLSREKERMWGKPLWRECEATLLCPPSLCGWIHCKMKQRRERERRCKLLSWTNFFAFLGRGHE